MQTDSTTLRCASAVSSLNDLDAAVAEVSGEIDARLDGAPPDLLFVFTTHHHGGDLARVSAELVETTGAAEAAGCTGAWTAGTGRELELAPGLSVLAARLPDTEVEVIRSAPPGEGGWDADALPIDDPERTSAIVLADPFSFPVPTFLDDLAETQPGLTVSGGLASGGIAPGQNILYAGADPVNSGAVTVLLKGATRVVSAVSQGCRPIGPPLVATRVEGNAIFELRGKPAAKVLFEVLEDLEESERELFQKGAFIGRAVDPARSTFRPGDLLVRNIMGLDPQRHAIAVADGGFRNGTTFQFMVRDGASAEAELASVLEIAGLESMGQASGGLLFTCGGRGQAMFGRPHHDAASVEAAFGPGFPLAGFAANGEIGPVGGRPFLHGFTASAAIFAPRA